MSRTHGKSKPPLAPSDKPQRVEKPVGSVQATNTPPAPAAPDTLRQQLTAAEAELSQLRPHVLVLEERLRHREVQLERALAEGAQARSALESLKQQYRHIGPGTLKLAGQFSTFKTRAQQAADKLRTLRSS